MRVTREVVQHVLGSPERRFRVDDPVLAKQRAEGRTKRLVVRERQKIARKDQPAATKGPLQSGDKLPAKHTTQDLHREEERIARMDPLRPVGRESSDRDNTVDVRVVQQILSPGVE